MISELTLIHKTLLYGNNCYSLSQFKVIIERSFTHYLPEMLNSLFSNLFSFSTSLLCITKIVFLINFSSFFVVVVDRMKKQVLMLIIWMMVSHFSSKHKIKKLFLSFKIFNFILSTLDPQPRLVNGNFETGNLPILIMTFINIIYRYDMLDSNRHGTRCAGNSNFDF